MGQNTNGDAGAVRRPDGRGAFRNLLEVVLAAAAAIAAVVAILGGLQLWWNLDRTTVAEVESMIDENLSPGATTDEIVAFLDSKDMASDGSVGRAEYNSVLLDSGYPSDTLIIGAFIYDTSRDLFITGDIQIFFILDEDYRLKEYLVREVFTGF